MSAEPLSGPEPQPKRSLQLQQRQHNLGYSHADETTPGRLRALVTVLTLLALTQSAYAQNVYESEYQAGQQLTRARKYDEAILHFTNEIKQEPKNAAAFRRRAEALLMVKQYQSAKDDFEQAIKLSLQQSTKSGHINRELGWSHRGLADAFMGMNQVPNALANYNEAIKADSNDRQAYLHRSICYRALNKQELAQQDINKAGELALAQRSKPKPPTPSAAQVRRLVSEATDRYHHNQSVDALATINKALQLDPKSKEALQTRYKCYMSLHRFELAIDDLKTLIKLEPNNGEVLRNLQDAKNWLKEFKSSKKDIAPIDKKAYAELEKATSLAQTGEISRAVAICTKHIRSRPLYESAYMRRADMYMMAHQFEKARADLDKSIELDPADKQAYINRSRLFDLRHDYANECKDLTFALKFDPHSEFASRHWIEELLSARALAYTKLHQYDKAISDYNELIKANPDDETIIRYRGDCYSSKGDFRNAVADYTKTIACDAESSGSTYYARAHAYEKLHEPRLAEADRRKAKELGYKPEQDKN